MILPSKIVKPAESLIYISSRILEVLYQSEMSVDEILEKINEDTKRKVTLKKVILGLNFLFIIDKIERKNEIIRIKI